MKTLFLLLALFMCFELFAQNTVIENPVKEDPIVGTTDDETSEDESIDEDDHHNLIFDPESNMAVPEAWDTNYDDLMNSWYIKIHNDRLNHSGYNENIPISDSIIMDRLSKLPNIIGLPYNQTVRNCINYYLRNSDRVERMLGLETYYFPMIEEALDKYGLPLELKYLAVVESALNPIALSRVGASGLWQFMLPTGKGYGLIINSLVDERRDPIKSTDAACRYLKELYEIYGDWHLALAAYNYGSGNVNKAIRRANNQKDYWAIYNYLPRETREYVPFFIAANYIMNYYPYHQLYPAETSLPFSTDTIMVNNLIHFDQIAGVLQMEKETIRRLNPQYKQDIIPGNARPQILVLPAMQAYSYVEKENEIATFRVNELFANRTTVGSNTGTSSRTERITHRVAAGGETLLSIANRYGVTATNIRSWNGLGSKITRVAGGRNLILHVDNGGVASANRQTASSTQRPATTAPPRPATTTAPKPATNSTTTSNAPASRDPNRSLSSVETERYRVRTGDSYFTIAQKYPGFSHTDLMRLNNVTNATLRVGQFILVPKN